MLPAWLIELIENELTYEEYTDLRKIVVALDLALEAGKELTKDIESYFRADQGYQLPIPISQALVDYQREIRKIHDPSSL